jgi:hypothetical protein
MLSKIQAMQRKRDAGHLGSPRATLGQKQRIRLLLEPPPRGRSSDEEADTQ